MWIAVDTNLLNSRLAVDMAEALDLQDHEVVGLLVLFWSAVKTLDRDGVVGDLSDAHLERLAHWRGTRGAFAKFIRERHLDADGYVRDWKDYQRDLQRSWRDSKRKSRGRPRDVLWTSDGRPVDVNEMSVECPKPTVQVQEQVQVQVPPPPPPPGVASSSPTVAFAVAVNAAITAQYGEQPNRIASHGSGNTLDAVKALADAGCGPEHFMALAARVELKTKNPPSEPSSYMGKAMLRLWTSGVLDHAATSPETMAEFNRLRANTSGALESPASIVSPPPPPEPTAEAIAADLARRRTMRATLFPDTPTPTTP